MANSSSTDPPVCSPGGEENFQLVWHNYQSNFHEVVGDVLTSEAFADVSLVAEGRLVRAHRLVLSACSPYLHNVLRALPAAPASHPVLLLPPEVSLATLHALLAFMYRGVVHVPHAALVAVLHAGDILQVRGLCRGDELQRPPLDSEVTSPRDSPLPAQPHTDEESAQHSTSSRRRRAGRSSGGHQGSSADKQVNSAVSNGGCSPVNQHTLQGVFDVGDAAAAVLGLVRVKEEPYDWSLHEQSSVSAEVDENMFRPTVLLATKNEKRGEAATSQPPASDDDEEPTPLTCEQCHEVFPRAAAWVRHLQIHPPVARPLAPPPPRTTASVASRGPRQSYSSEGPVRRPHVCVHCGKRFSSRASLSIHGRTHTGETPYTCDLCRKGFNVKSNLLRHLRTLHNRIVSPSDVDAPQI